MAMASVALWSEPALTPTAPIERRGQNRASMPHLGASQLRESSAPGLTGNVIRSAVGEGLDCTGRLVPPAGYETAAIHDEKVRDIVGPVVFVHHRRFRLVAPAAGTHS